MPGTSDGSIIFDASLDSDKLVDALNRLREVAEAFIRSFAGQFGEVGKSLDATQQKAKDLGHALRYDDANIEDLKRQQDELQQSIDNGRAALSAFADEEKKLDQMYQEGLVGKAEYDQLRNKIELTENALSAQEMQLIDVAQAIASYSEGTDNAADNTEKLKQKNDEVVPKLKDTGRQSEDTAGKVDTLTVAFGNLVARGIEKALSAMKDFIFGGIEYASDLQESQNVVETTFKHSSDTVVKFAETAKKQFGLSELQVNEFTGTIGAMLTSMQFAEQDALDMSLSITGLAADLGSFKNVKPEEALDKLRAGLTGESEPLKAWGITISESTTKAYAYKNGIAKAGEELTEQQKILSRYGQIMEKTTDAQGDFEKTLEGSYANQLKVAQTNLQQVSGILGEKLLPVITDALEKFNSFVEENGEILAGWGDFLADILSIVFKIVELIIQIPPDVIILIGVFALAFSAIIKINKAIESGTGLIGGLGKALDLANGTFMRTAIIVLAVAAAVALLLYLIIALTQGAEQAQDAMNSFGNTANNISSIQSNTQRQIARGGFAKGTLSAPRGTFWVGENGPELLEFQGGERVYNATQSRALAAAGGNGTIMNETTYYVTIDAKNVREFNDIVRMAQSAQQQRRTR